MSATRRAFLVRYLQGGIGALGLWVGGRWGSGFASAASLFPYEVVFRCEVPPHGGLGEYENKRQSFENVQAITSVNNEFQRAGRILEIVHTKTEGYLQWRYVFREKADYKAWNRHVYHGGLFSRKKLPSQFNMKITKRYLVPLESFATVERV